MNKAYMFFGLAGAGKGTQAKLLKENLENDGASVELFEVGAQLRGSVNNPDTKVLKQLKSAMDEGALVPSALPIHLLTKFLLEEYKGGDLIMDGSSRKLIEARLVSEALKFAGIEELNIILLNVTEEEVISRLSKRARSDDTIDSIKERINIYFEETAEAVDFLKELNVSKFIEVDGIGTIEEVHKRVIKSV